MVITIFPQFCPIVSLSNPSKFFQEPVPAKPETPVKIFEPKKIEIEEIFQETETDEAPKRSVPESPFKIPRAPAKKKSTGLKPEPTRDDSDLSDSETPNQNISLSIGCPSPKLTPYKQSSNEKELLDWSKKTLASYTQIKITNLSSSWRNGLGFCALIYEKYPELVPMNDLKMQNLRENCELAFEAAKLVGAETSLSVDDLIDGSMPGKSSVMAFLRELRLVLSSPDRAAIEPDVVTDFRKSWFRRCGYFVREVEEAVKAEDNERKADEEAEKLQKSIEARAKESAAAEEEEGDSSTPTVDGTEVDERSEEERRPVRDRVREMIATAHREASFEAGDVMSSGRVMRESKTISEEMSKLASEEERFEDIFNPVQDELEITRIHS